VQYDLHVHTHRSRGCRMPGTLLLTLARKLGLEGLGICELDAFPDPGLQPMASRLGLRLIQGTEFSCTDCRIIGYGMMFSDPETQDLQAMFDRVRARAQRNLERLADRLRTFDHGASMEGVRLHCGGALSRAALLHYFIHERPLFPSMAAARRFLDQENLTLDLEPVGEMAGAEAVERIRRAGGVAVWARPQTTPVDRQRPLLHELVVAGLQGVEMVYPYRENGYPGEASNEVLQARTLSLTKHHDLFHTGGSDSRYPFGPLDGRRPVLPGEYGVTAGEAATVFRAMA
jgi:hypothetical protein